MQSSVLDTIQGTKRVAALPRDLKLERREQVNTKQSSQVPAPSYFWCPLPSEASLSSLALPSVPSHQCLSVSGGSCPLSLQSLVTHTCRLLDKNSSLPLIVSFPRKPSLTSLNPPRPSPLPSTPWDATPIILHCCSLFHRQSVL